MCGCKRFLLLIHNLRTLELKLIGPSLVGCGMFFALLRDIQQQFSVAGHMGKKKF